LTFICLSAEYFLQKAFKCTTLLKVHTSWYKTNMFPLSVFEPEKHFLEQVLSSMIMNSYLNHQLFSTQKCLALALAIFRIFVMIMLLNTTSLLTATKLLVYFFA